MVITVKYRLTLCRLILRVAITDKTNRHISNQDQIHCLISAQKAHLNSIIAITVRGSLPVFSERYRPIGLWNFMKLNSPWKEWVILFGFLHYLCLFSSLLTDHKTGSGLSQTFWTHCFSNCSLLPTLVCVKVWGRSLPVRTCFSRCGTTLLGWAA